MDRFLDLFLQSIFGRADRDFRLVFVWKWQLCVFYNRSLVLTNRFLTFLIYNCDPPFFTDCNEKSVKMEIFSSDSDSDLEVLAQLSDWDSSDSDEEQTLSSKFVIVIVMHRVAVFLFCTLLVNGSQGFKLKTSAQ